MSVDINDPLSWVITNLTFVGDELDALAPELPSHVQERIADLTAALAEAREGADRVTRAIRELQRYARLDSAEPDVLDWEEAIERAIAAAGDTAPPVPTVEVVIRAAPTVVAARERLTQLVAELLRHARSAVAHLGEAGRIEIRVDGDPRGGARLEVVHNGRGISADVLPRLFEPSFDFQQRRDGTGLGLWMASLVAQSLGGTVQVESREVDGSVFRVHLPGK